MTTTTSHTARSTFSLRLPAVAILLSATIIGAVAAAVLGPHGRMADDRTGDPTLIADVEAAGADAAGIRSLSVGRIQDGESTAAGLGDAGDGAPQPNTRYELGSITKTFTGMLLADGIDRGELSLDDPLATQLPELADTAVGGVSLGSLATHTSGLPRLPRVSFVRSAVDNVRGADPYQQWSTERVIEAAATTELSDAGESAYSNFGMALLGAAEARAAGADSWTTLVRQRLLEPLGMSQTTFADTPEPLAVPHQSSGWPSALWFGEGFLPAGSGTRSTTDDMLRFAAAVLDGTAPGMAAIAPLYEVDDSRTRGMAWSIRTNTDTGQQILWHNGGTGGSRTMLTIDRDNNRAAIVLNNSATDVDALGLRLVGDESAEPDGGTVRLLTAVAVLVVALGAVLMVIVRALRGPTLIAQLSSVAFAIFALVLMLRFGPWEFVPAAVAGAVVGLAAGAVLLMVGRSILAEPPPALPAKQRWAAWLDLGISVLLAGAGLAML